MQSFEGKFNLNVIVAAALRLMSCNEHDHALALLLWVWDYGVMLDPLFSPVKNSFVIGYIKAIATRQPNVVRVMQRRFDEISYRMSVGAGTKEDVYDQLALKREFGFKEKNGTDPI